MKFELLAVELKKIERHVILIYLRFTIFIRIQPKIVHFKLSDHLLFAEADVQSSCIGECKKNETT